MEFGMSRFCSANAFLREPFLKGNVSDPLLRALRAALPLIQRASQNLRRRFVSADY
jgi:hypothetical protein